MLLENQGSWRNLIPMEGLGPLGRLLSEFVLLSISGPQGALSHARARTLLTQNSPRTDASQVEASNWIRLRDQNQKRPVGSS
eukprot:3671830-Amphidinium_carterae.1